MEKAQELVEELSDGGEENRALAIHCNVLDKESVQAAMDETIDTYGRIDALINGAGGNKPDASTNETKSFFDLPQEAIQWVLDLNLMGTIIPSQIASRYMAEQGEGIILNISSMNAFRPLTRIPAYSAAKAGVSNFTQWLAVHLAQEYSKNIRVNAIAPGFFMTNQNRFLLIDKETGVPSERGQKIIDHTPMGRYGVPEDLIGTTLWLLSPASAFITGVVIPIDGGFSAYSGV
jgi:NAD(P)-dependent dehydrogenase (short-subunit alcohol dehydrogenase family)